MTATLIVPSFALSSGALAHIGVCPRHGLTAIPDCRHCVRQQLNRQVARWVIWFAGLAVFVLSLGSGRVSYLIVGFAAVLGALVYSFMGPTMVQTGTFKPASNEVELKQVAPEFAAAVQDLVAAAAAPQPQVYGLEQA